MLVHASSPAARRNRSLFLLALLPLVVGLFNLVIGQVQFAGYDSSVLVDAGWRLLQHQQTYRDFYSLLPPAFSLLSELSLYLFGLHWFAFNLTEALIYWLLSALGLHLSAIASTRRHETTLDAPLTFLYLVAISLPILVTSHLWHSTLAAQIDTALIFTLLFLFRTFHDTTHWSRTGLTYAVILIAALLLSKPNATAVALLTCLLFPLLSSRPARALQVWLLILAVSTCIATVILLLVHIAPLDVLRSYTKISDRPSALTLLRGDPTDWQSDLFALSSIGAYSFIGIFTVAGVACLAAQRKLRSDVALASLLVGLALSLTGFATNWDLRYNDLAPGIFGSGAFLLTALGSEPWSRAPARRWLAYSLLALSAAALTVAVVLSATRTRMQIEGPWARPEDGPLTLRNDSFFGPFFGSKALWTVLALTDQACDSAPPQSHIYFGPRLEFLYARRHLPSPKGLPIWFHRGSSYPTAAEPQIVHHWIDSRFDLLFFAAEPGDRYTRIPPAILAEIATHYDRISPPGSPIDIYRRR